MANVTGLIIPEHRTAALSYYAGVSMVFRLVFSILAARMMDDHAWLAIWLGCAGYFVAVLWSLLLPSKKMEESSSDDSTEGGNERFSMRIMRMMRDWQHRVVSGAASLMTWEGLPVLLVLLTLVMTTVAWQSQMVLDQFIRLKYGWKWSQVWAALHIIMTPCCY